MKWFFFLNSLFISSVQAGTCDLWFLHTNVTPGIKGCQTKCETAPVGMDSFMCHDACDKFCATTIPRYITEQLTYPNTLKKSEKDLIAKYPLDALKVFRAKIQAENSTRRLFPANGHNDESDAFRHFMWSSLITKSIGADQALLFTSAHEEDPNQPPEEKEMDLANNKAGIDAAKSLKDLSTEELEKAALKALNEHRLKVLSPSGEIPDWSSE